MQEKKEASITIFVELGGVVRAEDNTLGEKLIEIHFYGGLNSVPADVKTRMLEAAINVMDAWGRGL